MDRYVTKRELSEILYDIASEVGSELIQHVAFRLEQEAKLIEFEDKCKDTEE